MSDVAIRDAYGMRPVRPPGWPLGRSTSAAAGEAMLAHAIASNPRSVFRGVEIRYLFPSWEQAHDMRASSEAGFSDLLGPSAEQDPDVTARLERRVEQLDPALARRCVELTEAAFA